MNNQRNVDGGIFLFLLPILLISWFFTLLAYIAARMGMRRAIVKMLNYPTGFVISNFILLIMVGMFGIFFDFLVGGRGTSLFAFVWNNMADLAVLDLWGPFVFRFYHLPFEYDHVATTPYLVIMLWQLFCYWAIGRHVQNLITQLMCSERNL